MTLRKQDGPCEICIPPVFSDTSLGCRAEGCWGVAWYQPSRPEPGPLSRLAKYPCPGCGFVHLPTLPGEGRASSQQPPELPREPPCPSHFSPGRVPGSVLSPQGATLSGEPQVNGGRCVACCRPRGGAIARGRPSGSLPSRVHRSREVLPEATWLRVP